MKLQTFMAMGGFAWYVWPAYAISGFILLANLFVAKRKHKTLLKRVADAA